MAASRIAVIEGDGIGKEVVPEGIRVVEAAARRFGLEIVWERFDWSCDRYSRLGRMMPENGLELIAGHDAIFLGAIGWPNVSDVESLWTLLMPIRRGFQQYVNLRPVRLFQGVPSPLARPGEIDMCIVRENNEGEYSEIGGRIIRARKPSWRSRKPSSPVRLRSGHAFRLRTGAQAQTSSDLRDKVQRHHSSPCRTGTSASARWAANFPTSPPSNITSTS